MIFRGTVVNELAYKIFGRRPDGMCVKFWVKCVVSHETDESGHMFIPMRIAPEKIEKIMS